MMTSAWRCELRTSCSRHPGFRPLSSGLGAEQLLGWGWGGVWQV